MTYPSKGRADYFDFGDWDATCSMCGRKRKASTLVKNWQGLYRCPEHNEPRHPQDFVRATPDIQTPPWTQPPSDTFAAICSLQGRCSIAGYAVAGCWIIGYTNTPFLETGGDPGICTVEGISGIVYEAVVDCSYTY